MDRATLFITVTLIAVLHVGGARGQPADTEGAALSTLPVYVQWMGKNCGDPAKAKGAECLALKDKLCGTRDTSEVLCLTGGPGPEVQFRSASRYTRVGYLRCSLTQLKCTTDPETYTGPAQSVDPVSLAKWVEYTNKCTASSPNPAPASQCAQLSGDHCSRPDVKCGKDTAEFMDIGNKATKKYVLRGDYSKGLVYLQ